MGNKKISMLAQGGVTLTMFLPAPILFHTKFPSNPPRYAVTHMYNNELYIYSDKRDKMPTNTITPVN